MKNSVAVGQKAFKEKMVQEQFQPQHYRGKPAHSKSNQKE